MKKLTAFTLVFALLLGGCAPASAGTENLMEDVPDRVICLAETPDCTTQAAEFALRLFQNSLEEGKNTLVSPLSVLSALAMTTNGAECNTLSQMEETLGAPISDWNAYLYSFLDGQADSLKLANSIWFKDAPSLEICPEFLETNADFFQSDIFRTPMDHTTPEAINTWVREKTGGTIPKLVDKVEPQTLMYLINALAFEAEWEDIYDETQIWEGTFTAADGTQQSAEFMSSKESLYLEDENATGFLKYYAGRDYAFVALLPREGVSVADYVSSLTGEHLQELLENPEQITTYAKLPKFETEYDLDMTEILIDMGMTDAFDPALADFTRLGSSKDGNIFIGKVLHKTYLSVAEQGTKAGAATVVEIVCGAALIQDYREVNLDRPFVYMLIDCEQNLPFFIGTVMDLEN